MWWRVSRISLPSESHRRLRRRLPTASWFAKVSMMELCRAAFRAWRMSMVMDSRGLVHGCELAAFDALDHVLQ